jgi:hypothetical protein
MNSVPESEPATLAAGFNWQSAANEALSAKTVKDRFRRKKSNFNRLIDLFG